MGSAKLVDIAVAELVQLGVKLDKLLSELAVLDKEFGNRRINACLLGDRHFFGVAGEIGALLHLVHVAEEEKESGVD
jgi:hypothetical protein